MSLDELRDLLGLLQDYGVHEATVNGVTVKMAPLPSGQRPLDLSKLSEDDKKKAVIEAMKERLKEDEDIERWSVE